MAQKPSEITQAWRIATRERRSPRHFWGHFCAAAGQAFACHAQIRHGKTAQSVPADATRSWPTSAEDSDPVHTSGSRSSSCGRAHDNKRVCSRHSHNSIPPTKFRGDQGRYRADWEPAATSGKCMAGVPGVFWRSLVVFWGLSAHNPALVPGKTHTSKN